MDNELSREQIEDMREDGPQIVTNSAWQALIRMALSYLDAKADAGRYRFIRYHSPSWFTACWAAPKHPSDDQIDTAIDQAMREEHTEKGGGNG